MIKDILGKLMNLNNQRYSIEQKIANLQGELQKINQKKSKLSFELTKRGLSQEWATFCLEKPYEAIEQLASKNIL